MARICAAFEFGAGNGHTGISQPICEELCKRGHELVVVGPKHLNLAGCVQVSHAQKVVFDLSLSHAPVTRGLLNYSAILAQGGYLNREALKQQVSIWVQVLKSHQIDAVFASFAPTAMIAAAICNIPYNAIGLGYECPPLEKPMPSMDPHASGPKGILEAVDKRLLTVINDVATEFGGQPFEAVKDIFGPYAPLLTMTPELDQYPNRQNGQYIGPVYSPIQSGRKPVWPGGKGAKVFAYLPGDHPLLPGLVSSLGHLKYPALIVLRGEPAQVFSVKTNVKISYDLFDISAVLEEADVMVCHGGNLMTNSILHGKPTLMLPLFQEQHMAAFAGARHDLLHVCDTRRHLKSCLKLCATDVTFKNTLRAYAEKRKNYRDVNATITRCSDLIERLVN